jgi:ElaB/YqjD/DUF883 family membrane-anchored ribosome-binding protein
MKKQGRLMIMMMDEAIPATTEKTMNKSSDEITKVQLIADFNAVMADVEALLKATADQGGEKLAGMRARVEDSLKVARAGMAKAQTALLVRTKAAGNATDTYIHENPWKASGIAAGVAMLIGLLIGRR